MLTFRAELMSSCKHLNLFLVFVSLLFRYVCLRFALNNNLQMMVGAESGYYQVEKRILQDWKELINLLIVNNMLNESTTQSMK